MESFIKATDGLKGISAVWAHNDNMMLGAIQAMKEAGLKPGKDILTVSVDGVPDLFKAMLAGDANASVELRSDIGPDVFAVVKAYLAGKHDWPKWVVIPSDLHTIQRRCGSVEEEGRLSLISRSRVPPSRPPERRPAIWLGGAPLADERAA